MTIQITRGSPRSFLQISTDPHPGRDDTPSIAAELKEARRVARRLSGELERFRIGVDFTDLSNIRVTRESVLFFVRTAAQQNKLRQILPLIDTLIGECGLLQHAEIRMRPTKPKIEERENLALGKDRKGSKIGSESTQRAAESLEDSPLKDALIRLSQTLATSC